MAGEICPECFHEIHSACIGNGCYCDCQLDIEEDDWVTVKCIKCGGTGLAPEGYDCEYCEGEGEYEI